MKLSTILKSAVGLIYTTIFLIVVEFGAVWLTQFIIRLDWTGAIIFWLIVIPIAIGLFQFIATIAGIPVVYLFKGSKWISWLMLLPTLYVLYSYGAFLWNLASAIGGVLAWLILISWFFETAWLFVSYCYIAIGSAYESADSNLTPNEV